MGSLDIAWDKKKKKLSLGISVATNTVDEGYERKIKAKSQQNSLPI